MATHAVFTEHVSIFRQRDVVAHLRFVLLLALEIVATASNWPLAAVSTLDATHAAGPLPGFLAFLEACLIRSRAGRCAAALAVLTMAPALRQDAIEAAVAATIGRGPARQETGQRPSLAAFAAAFGFSARLDGDHG